MLSHATCKKQGSYKHGQPSIFHVRCCISSTLFFSVFFFLKLPKVLCRLLVSRTFWTPSTIVVVWCFLLFYYCFGIRFLSSSFLLSFFVKQVSLKENLIKMSEGIEMCSTPPVTTLNGDDAFDMDSSDDEGPVVKKVPTSGRRDFKEMPIQHDKHLRSMKEVLSTMDPNAEPNSHIEFKEKTHILCARFLGGAWKTVSLDNMKITRIKGGMSNMLFLCRLTENHPPIRNEPDKVLLRVYFNPETESHLVAESVIFTLLSERHLGPKLYGIFSGGRLEEYIPSRPLKCHEIAIPSMSNKIAKRLAHVHQLEVPIWKEPDYLCDALERWLHQLVTIPGAHSSFEIPEKYHEWAPKVITTADIEKEIEYLRGQIVHSTSKVSFCHNDMQEGNILLPKASSGNIRMPSISDEQPATNSLSAFNPLDPRLVLIDFEYASYNYRGFDFANHFVEYSINYEIDEPPYYEIKPENVPSKERMFEFMLSYLKELNPNKDDNELEPNAHSMVEETVPFIPVSHLLWGVWGLLQVEVSPVGFGFAEYGCDRLGLYFKNRPLLEEFH